MIEFTNNVGAGDIGGIGIIGTGAPGNNTGVCGDIPTCPLGGVTGALRVAPVQYATTPVIIACNNKVASLSAMPLIMLFFSAATLAVNKVAPVNGSFPLRTALSYSIDITRANFSCAWALVNDAFACIDAISDVTRALSNSHDIIQRLPL